MKLLWFALIALAVTLTQPTGTFRRAAYDVLFVVDITGSMNTRDYVLGGAPISRLDRTKVALRSLLTDLPCRSRVGLGIFTERQSFLLLEPVEICGNFAALDGAIDALDWRMAWEGDSYVARGLYSAIALSQDLQATLMFLTDGHEAPPLPTSGPPPFSSEGGEVTGLIVGVGGLSPVPIPKFDERGSQVGFYTMADVPQENRSGMPPKDAASRAGYNPRNAPFGGAAAVGTEHLTSLREEYLETLARNTSLGYVRLEGDLHRAVRRYARPRWLRTRTDLRPLPALLALAALAWFWSGVRFATLQDRR